MKQIPNGISIEHILNENNKWISDSVTTDEILYVILILDQLDLNHCITALLVKRN